MSMPIQRQSDQYAAFDSGTRWERDRSSTDMPKGLAGLVNSMGPRIQAGLLDTRQAGYGRSFSMGDSPYSAGWGPADHGGAGPDGGPRHPREYYEDDSEDEGDPYIDDLDNHDPERYISSDDIREARRGSGRLPFDRAAAAAPAPVVGGHVFQPGHLVKTMWRGEPRNGVVTGTDGPYVKVYYDDHQHLYEDPQDLQLR